MAGLVLAIGDHNNRGELRELRKAPGIRNMVILGSTIFYCCNRLRDTLKKIRRNLSEYNMTTQNAIETYLADFPNMNLLHAIRSQDMVIGS